MERYIDADKVKELIRNYGKGAIADGRTTLDTVDDLVCLVSAVDFILTADVVEVKHGKWTELGRCSCCDAFSVSSGDDYCPNCGAKMDGEEQCKTKY